MKRKLCMLTALLVLAACATLRADESWKNLLLDIGRSVGDHLAGAENGILFYAYDTLAYPGEKVDLAARLQELEGLFEIPGVTLGFHLDGKLVGKAETGEDGRALLPWTPPKQGDYTFTVKVLEQPRNIEKDLTKLTPASLLVAARPKDTQLAVIDLDHTVVKSRFARVLLGGAKPMPFSQKVVKRLADDYTVVYLTQRPNLLSNKSKDWLVDHNFHRGPLLMNDLANAFGDSGKFKTARLKALRETYPNVALGIGDKLSDAGAYVANDAKAYLIPYYRDKPEDMRKMADDLEALKKAVDNDDKLHVVGGWDEIEKGIYQNKRYPADPYIKSLRERAGKGSFRWPWEDD